MTKIRVAVIFGGTNTEHEVSLVSAQGVIANLDQNKYAVLPVKITKENTWITPKEISASYTPILSSGLVSADRSLDTVENILSENAVDVIFPVLHGPFGEDGTIQGMLDLMRLPYVGCGVAASAVCMDKVLQKNICQSYGIPMVPFFWFTRGEWETKKAATLANLLHKFSNSYPLFVKPANQGSSVGITKAHNQKELLQGIQAALTRDLKVVVEQAVPHAREIECAVLGRNDAPQTSVLGEIIPGNEFYDYGAKYINDNSRAIIPANLPENIAEKIQQTARLAFQVLDCWGLARIDFLLNADTHEYYLNELNTMPGFTPISMYPKLWEASGLSYPDLLSCLIDLALVKHQERATINLSR